MRKGFIAEVEDSPIRIFDWGRGQIDATLSQEFFSCGVLSHREKSLIDDSLCFSLLWSFYFVKNLAMCLDFQGIDKGLGGLIQIS